jgi:hypothetical protein
MHVLINQRTELQDQKLLLGGILLYRGSAYIGVNYTDLCAVTMAGLYYPLDGNQLANNTRMVPTREILQDLEAQFGPKYSLHDYRPPLKQKYVILGEHTATTLIELNTLLERFQRQMESRCYCPAQEKSFAAAGQICLPISTVDKEFLVSNFHSTMSEAGRIRTLDNCKRLINMDAEMVLAASVALHQLDQTEFMRDPVRRSGMESRERELSASYA